ncbi:MAG TPA: hypothetical protein VNF04_06525, partial [Stellaceae bacterium]|nr:hypothetical protein [Stellaceae bacterium]
MSVTPDPQHEKRRAIASPDGLMRMRMRIRPPRRRWRQRSLLQAARVTWKFSNYLAISSIEMAIIHRN